MIRRHRRRPTFIATDASTSHILRFVLGSTVLSVLLATAATTLLASSIEWMIR